MQETELEKFRDYVRGIFQPPPLGEERMILTLGFWWKFKSGYANSLLISTDGKEWRKPTDFEYDKFADGFLGE